MDLVLFKKGRGFKLKDAASNILQTPALIIGDPGPVGYDRVF